MGKSEEIKSLIFSRYIGQFQQATEETATIRKSSEEIAFELSGMVSFSTWEITEQMISFGYTIGFDDAKPIWLMIDNNINKIQE